MTDFPQYIYVAIDEDGDVYATDDPADIAEMFSTPVRTARYTVVGEGLTRADPHYVEFGDDARA